LEYLETDSGLAVPLTGADEASVSRALKEYDSDLVLIPQDSDAYGRRIYRVARRVGGDRPVQWVVTWRTREGDALPLSHRLVEKVKELDLNSRNKVDDPDDLNAQLKVDRQKDYDVYMDDMVQDHLGTHKGRFITPRSTALALARRRGRRKGAW
jgi:hypothetical protein